jgi:hypothetical protein
MFYSKSCSFVGKRYYTGRAMEQSEGVLQVIQLLQQRPPHSPVLGWGHRDAPCKLLTMAVSKLVQKGAFPDNEADYVLSFSATHDCLAVSKRLYEAGSDENCSQCCLFQVEKDGYLAVGGMMKADND